MSDHDDHPGADPLAVLSGIDAPAAGDRPRLTLDEGAYTEMVAHAYRGYPYEACGLLGGRPGSGLAATSPGGPGAAIDAFVACRNADGSARTYSIGPDGFLAADRAFDPLGLEVVGVVHSHTHTDAYPSPTDVAKADNPLLAGWHYLIVSLRDTDPVLRAYLIDGETVTEEVVSLSHR